MSAQTGQTLKNYFAANAIPTAGNFADLIDSFISKLDDNVTVSAQKNFGIGTSSPLANLTVKSREFQLSGSLSSNAVQSQIAGIGSKFLTELSVGSNIRIGTTRYTVGSITSDILMTLGEAITTPIANATGFVILDILDIQKADGSSVIYATNQGKVGINNAAPTEILDVTGTVKATAFTGDGHALTNITAGNIAGNIPATKISGTIDPTQIPAIPASSLPPMLGLINSSGNSVLSVLPQGRVGINNPAPQTTLSLKSSDYKLTGSLSSTATPMQVAGLNSLFVAELSTGSKLKIGTAIYTVNVITSNVLLTVTESISPAFASADGFLISDIVNVQSADNSSVLYASRNGYVGINNTAPQAVFSVKSREIILTGTLASTAVASQISGIGSMFLSELTTGAKIRIGTATFTVNTIPSDVLMTVTEVIPTTITAATGYYLPDILHLQNADNTAALHATSDGKIGINNNAPTEMLDVTGTVKAVSFVGNGSMLTNLSSANLVGNIPSTLISGIDAAAITGTLTNAQLPNIPATKITGILTAAQLPDTDGGRITGTLNVAQIPDIPATKITGVLATAQLPNVAAANITGTLSASQIPDLPATKITGVLTAAQLPDTDSGRITGTINVAQLPDIPATKITGVLATAQLPNIAATNLTGTLSASQIPDIPATKITGILTAAQLPDTDGGRITGTLNVAQIPDIPATKITGVLATTQLPNIAAANITGTLSASQISDLPATKITGILTAAQLPDTDGGRITGTINVAQIPDIPATKITGVLATAQLPDIAATNLTGTLSASQIPDIPATKITGVLTAAHLPDTDGGRITGTLNVAQIPDIPATKITGVLATSQLPDIAATNLTGTLSVSQIPDLPATKITGVFTAAQLPDTDGGRITGTLNVAQIPDIPATKITGVLATSQLPDIAATNLTGTLSASQIPDLPATKITGVLASAQLPNIDGGNITGTINVAQIPNVPATKITGILTATQLPNIPAANITGPLTVSQMPDLPATKITGILTSAQLPNIAATNINGQLTVSQIPDLPATKITGVFTTTQLPDIDGNKITGLLNSSQIPNLPASKITGVLGVAQLPVLPAANITGTLSMTQIPDIPAGKIIGPLVVAQMPDIPVTKITGVLTLNQLPDIESIKVKRYITVFVDKPVIDPGETLNLSWYCTTIDRLTISYVKNGDRVILDSATDPGVVPIASGTYALAGITSECVFTFTGYVGTTIKAQVQMIVTVGQSLAFYLSQLKSGNMTRLLDQANVYKFNITMSWGSGSNTIGPWIMGTPNRPRLSALTVSSPDAGKTLIGTIKYSGDIKTRDVKMTIITGNVLWVEERTGTSFEPVGAWMMISNIVALSFSSPDNGYSFEGTLASFGSGGVGFRAVPVS